MNIDLEIARLVQYGIDAGLVPAEEKIFTTNLLLDVLKKEDFHEPEEIGEIILEDVLKNLLDYAWAKGILEDQGVTARDLFDTRLMSCLVPRPRQVIDRFYELYAEDPVKATDYYYAFSQATDYIRTYRVKKDLKWKVDSPYGKIDITINLSKP